MRFNLTEAAKDELKNGKASGCTIMAILALAQEIDEQLEYLEKEFDPETRSILFGSMCTAMEEQNNLLYRQNRDRNEQPDKGLYAVVRERIETLKKECVELDKPEECVPCVEAAASVMKEFLSTRPRSCCIAVTKMRSDEGLILDILQSSNLPAIFELFDSVEKAMASTITTSGLCVDYSDFFQTLRSDIDMSYNNLPIVQKSIRNYSCTAMSPLFELCEGRTRPTHQGDDYFSLRYTVVEKLLELCNNPETIFSDILRCAVVKYIEHVLQELQRLPKRLLPEDGVDSRKAFIPLFEELRLRAVTRE